MILVAVCLHGIDGLHAADPGIMVEWCPILLLIAWVLL